MLLKVEHLTKRFGGLVAVSDVSFAIDRGQIIGIFGPNGSGKTTLLNLLAGMLRPTGGHVFWKEHDIAGAKPDVIAAGGVIKTFQNPQLFSELTVYEHLMIASFLAFSRMKNESRLKTFFSPSKVEAKLRHRAQHALELCRLQDASRKIAAELSYGEEKMLGVAMAMMCEPELLLLDEPGSGLGKDEIVNLGNVLRDLCAHGTTLCIIDHKVAFLAEFADLHHPEKVTMRGADELDVDRHGLDAAQRRHLTLRQHTQQAGLQVEPHVADLVEKQSAVVAGGDLADLSCLETTSERARFVAKQFAVEQGVRDSRTVHGDERTISAQAAQMQGPGEGFFAAACLALQQDGNVAVDDAAGQQDILAHPLVAAGKLIEG